MIKVNDKVMFKDNYVGYFDDRKGEEECKKHESSDCLNPDDKRIKITYMVEV